MQTFAHKIDKQSVADMPSLHFEGEIIEVRTAQQAREAVDCLLESVAVGIDTETRPAFKKGVSYPVALLQVATLTKCYLFRLNLINDYSDIQRLFESETTKKVGLSLKDDIRALKGRIKGMNPKNIADVQDMVNDYGIFELSLQKIFAIVFNMKISKTQRLTNWEADCLTPAQQQYAATDAWATLLLYQQLLRQPKITAQQKELIRLELQKIEEQRLQEKLQNTQELSS
ncbi:MAG: 3'-5' exonuclease domain-containing protein 2 [Paludibacteraceae bacterium]|nr:3'-5' exonuclease domain-containing protein 2 [Paludibacteraceae bacterium]